VDVVNVTLTSNIAVSLAYNNECMKVGNAEGSEVS
jgi:hypothetical protein